MLTSYAMPAHLGDIVRITPLTQEDSDDATTADAAPLLFRTPSTYGYGFSLHLHPDPSRTYVVCGIGDSLWKDGGTMQSLVLCVQGDPGLTVGFGLFYDAHGCAYTRVTQVGFDPIPVTVEVLGRAESWPLDRGFVGSRVMLAQRT